MPTGRAFVVLDGLRGIAALVVLTWHAPAYFMSVSPPDGTGPFFQGYLAVDFFFVLSGFVLAHAYEERLRKEMTAAQFMTIRLIRLYPLYLLALAIAAISVAIRVAHGEVSTISAVKNLSFGLLFLPAPALVGTAMLFPLNVPAWSLFFELLANLGFGVAARRLSDRGLITFVVAACLVLIVAVSAGLLGFKGTLGAMAGGFYWQSFPAGLARVAWSFFAGVLVYRLYRAMPPQRISPWLPAATLIAVLVVRPPAILETATDLIETIVVFPLIVWLAAGSVAQPSAARLFAWLGAASYAVYVLQYPLYDLTSQALGVAGATNLSIVWGLSFVGLVFAVAAAADCWLDQPVRARLTRLYIGQTAPNRLRAQKDAP